MLEFLDPADILLEFLDPADILLEFLDPADLLLEFLDPADRHDWSVADIFTLCRGESALKCICILQCTLTAVTDYTCVKCAISYPGSD